MPKFESVDGYVGSLPPEVQSRLEDVRDVIHRAVPGSEEGISYDILAVKLHGRSFLGLAGWKGHISIYPIPAAEHELDRELAPYKSGRGTLKFSLREPMPLELVGKVAALLANQRAGGPSEGGIGDDRA